MRSFRIIRLRCLNPLFVPSWRRITALAVYPVARRTDMTIRQSGDDTLIHDHARHHFHTLNAAATLVWSACDGSRDIGALCMATGLELDVVQLALDGLSAAGLLVEPVAGSGLSRRDVVRRLAAAGVAGAVALPVIASITEQSVSAAGTVCFNIFQCQPDHKCVGGVCVLSEGCLPNDSPCAIGGGGSECCSDFCTDLGQCQVP